LPPINLATDQPGEAITMGGKNKGETRVSMPADCRIADVGALHTQLRGALGSSQIVLDGGAVDRVDTAALQLLVVFQREAKQRERQVQWAEVSAPLHDAASQLGLTEALALPAKKPA
jgi:ABC-type transporter Mla MlaB component